MRCPKCGGEIPFYDLKPNCRHCGVNIMYYSQEAQLAHDAKRTELESAAARMTIARIKAAYIGSKAAIIRMIVSISSAAVLLLPFGSLKLIAPFYEKTLTAGLLGVITGFGDLAKIPTYLKSAMFSDYTKAFLLPVGILAILLLLVTALFFLFILCFLNLEKSAKAMRITSLVGAVIALLGQIAVLVMDFARPLPATPAAQIHTGWGGFAIAAVWLAVFFLNHLMLRQGIEPTYRENDVKRRELLKQVRRGEVDLDSLPLPVMESPEEREERMKALQEALKAEEEGKEL